MKETQDIQSWTMATPERWYAFYVRVTNQESLKADLSIPNQIARAKEIAAERGWSDWRIYVERKNVTAELWVEKRPALRSLVEDIVAGRIIGICARHTDRLWRGNEIQSRLCNLLREHGVELWDFSTRHEYKSAHGRFALQVLGAVSELEVNVTSERIREMKRGKARKGKTGGGPPAFGYTSQSRRIQQIVALGHSEDEAYRQACLDFPVGKTWYIDEKEAEVVRLIFDLYTSSETRYGTKRIGRYLNARGYKTRTGCSWLSNYIRSIINNPAYAGFTTFDEAAYAERLPSRLPRRLQERFAGEHSPLISVEQWEKAQAIKESENPVKRVRSGPSARETFSLTGILRCPKCDSRMAGKSSPHTTRRYYICGRRHCGGVDLCNFPLIDANALQREVWSWIHGLLTSPAFVIEHVERLRTKLAEAVPDAARQLAALERRQGEVRAAMGKYFALLEASTDRDRDAVLLERVRELRAEAQALEGESTALRSKLAALPPRAISVEHVQAYLAKLRARVDGRPEVQRVLFHELKREHDLRVKALSKDEFIISIALPTRELFGADRPSIAPDRLFTVAAGSSGPRGGEGGASPRGAVNMGTLQGAEGTTSRRGSEGMGLPAPGGPMKSRL